MSKLTYKSDTGYEYELDIASTMCMVMRTGNTRYLDNAINELKQHIIKNSLTLKPYEVPKPWHLRHTSR